MPAPPILVIDDSPTLLKLVQLTLSQAGHRVEIATDAQSATDFLRQQTPGLVLLDDALLDATTDAICHAVRTEAGGTGVPIVLMRSNIEGRAPSVDPAAGIVDAISKPFTPDALRAVVTHVLDQGGGKTRADRERPVSLTPVEGVLVNEDAVPDLGGLALAGDLAVVNLADVLALVGDRQQTGRLQAHHDRARVSAFVKFGRLVFTTAAGVPEEFLLGRFLVAQGHVSRKDLDDIIARKHRSGESRLLGALLIEHGLIDDRRLTDGVTAQTTAIIHEAMRWNRGRFAFDTRMSWPPGAVDSGVSLPIDRLVMEGLRKVDEWHIIEREINDFDMVLVRDDDRLQGLGRGQLLADEIAVANLVNGKNAIKDIIAQSDKGSFEVSKILFRLMRSKLVRRRVPPGMV